MIGSSRGARPASFSRHLADEATAALGHRRLSRDVWVESGLSQTADFDASDPHYDAKVWENSNGQPVAGCALLECDRPRRLAQSLRLKDALRGCRACPSARLYRCRFRSRPRHRLYLLLKCRPVTQHYTARATILFRDGLFTLYSPRRYAKRRVRSQRPRITEAFLQSSPVCGRLMVPPFAAAS
jgi:hypothetical protein